MKNVSTAIAMCMLFASSAAFAQTPAPAAASGAPNDAQIAEIVVTVDNGEINEAKLAKSKAKSPKVKKFAQEMITDHGKANKKTAALASKLKMKPEKSADSKQLKQESMDQVKKLKGLKGAEFDKEYIDAQVTDHQKTLDKLDTELIPNAKNPELKEMLTTTRATIAKHLENAKTVQASLK